MTETATQPETQEQASRDPIVNALVPMFLSYAGNNAALARKAAVNTINSYRFHGHGELVSVVQIIAFSLASIRALGLTMTDEIPLNLIARFQTNANTLQKSEHRQRAILRQPPPEQRQIEPEAAPPPQPEPEPEPEQQSQEQPAPPRPVQPQPTPFADQQTAKAFAALNALLQAQTQQSPPPPFATRHPPASAPGQARPRT